MTIATDTTTVYKYEVPVSDVPWAVGMPIGAKILHVGVSGTDPMTTVWIWAEVARDVPTEIRSFQLTGTGHPVPDGLTYVGTAYEAMLPLVWHVWEVTMEVDQ